MAKSKLESYEDLLTALVGRYLSVDSLAFSCGMDCMAVNQRLIFLIRNGLVEERQCHSKTLYALTKRGLTIQRTLAVTKRLDELKVTVNLGDETISTVPRGFNQSEETEHQS